MMPSISASNQQASDASNRSPNTFYAGSFGSPSLFGMGSGGGNLLPVLGLVAIVGAIFLVSRKR